MRIRIDGEDVEVNFADFFIKLFIPSWLILLLIFFIAGFLIGLSLSP